MARDLVFVKTDKNGTKYFHDWNCPRCGGAGFADKWINTGRTCWACGGSGMRSVAKIVKEYTPEYWEKLNARRRAKEEKRIAAEKKYAEEHADELAEKMRMVIENRYAEFGCGKDGVGYVLEGRGTYKAKEAIKKAGGKWGCCARWVCPVKFEGPDITCPRKIDLSGHIGGGSVIWVHDDFDLYDAVIGWEKED